MKIAIIFLVLGVSCFIEPISCNLNRLNPDQVKCHAHAFLQCCEELDALKTGPKEERGVRKDLLLQKINFLLIQIASQLGCTTHNLLKSVDFEDDFINGLTGNVDLDWDDLELDKLVGATGTILEAATAQLNLLLKPLLSEISGSLGINANLAGLPLHDCLEGVVGAVAGTGLGILLGITGIVGGIVTSLLPVF